MWQNLKVKIQNHINHKYIIETRFIPKLTLSETFKTLKPKPKNDIWQYLKSLYSNPETQFVIALQTIFYKYLKNKTYPSTLKYYDP